MYETLSTDAILERLAWIVDRQRYRMACRISGGETYAEDCKAERELLAELTQRYTVTNKERSKRK